MSMSVGGASTWNRYRRKGLAEMRPYVPGEDMTGISVSAEDVLEQGGMIARNPANHADRWYVARAYFEQNFDWVKLAGDDRQG